MCDPAPTEPRSISEEQLELLHRQASYWLRAGSRFRTAEAEALLALLGWHQTEHGSDFPLSAERGCGASGKEGARDTPGEPAREASEERILNAAERKAIADEVTQLLCDSEGWDRETRIHDLDAPAIRALLSAYEQAEARVREFDREREAWAETVRSVNEGRKKAEAERDTWKGIAESHRDDNLRLEAERDTAQASEARMREALERIGSIVNDQRRASRFADNVRAVRAEVAAALRLLGHRTPNPEERCGCKPQAYNHLGCSAPDPTPEPEEPEPTRSARLLYPGAACDRRSSDVGETGHRARLSGDSRKAGT